MDHQIIETFVTVASTRNVSQAAELLHLSQSAVSKRIKLLEQELGLLLFERVKGNKTFFLTPAGERFVGVAGRWQAVWRETQSLRHENDRISLSLGTLDSLSYAFLPSLYQALARHQPKLNLTVVTSHSRELYDLVDRREVDVAFTLLRREHPNIIVERCFTEAVVGLRMASDDLELPDIVHPRELDPAEELYVDWGQTVQIWHDQWWDVSCPGRILLDTAQLIFSFFHHPGQWAVVPLSVADKARQTGQFRIFRFEGGQPDRICYKIRHKYPKSGTQEGMRIFEHCLERLLASP